MTDNRVRVQTNGKTIDLEQLDTELGGHGLCGGVGEVVVVEGSPVTSAELEAALESHVAVFPTPAKTADEVAASLSARLADRDELLGELADWLLDIDMRTM